TKQDQERRAAESKAKAAEAKAKAAAKEKLAQERRHAEIPFGPEPATRFNKDVRSWRELQQYHVVMQRYDYSCGAAALATMIRYYFNDSVTEQQLLEEMIKPLSAEQQKDRQKLGFSMEDLF